jgi:hypothetical protein
MTVPMIIITTNDYDDRTNDHNDLPMIITTV